ncbi:hypothetical protein Tco_1025397, partial [Tanacetum coccineum]
MMGYPSDSSSSDSSLRYSSSSYAISDFLNDSSTATSIRLSRKRCRSPTSSVPAVSPVRGSLSLVHVDLSPPPKRIRDSDSVTDLKISSEDGYEPYVPREVGLGVDFEDSYEPYIEHDINSDIQAYIDKCITYADAIRARGMDDRDVVDVNVYSFISIEMNTIGYIYSVHNGPNLEILGKKEGVKSIALKAKKDSSDDETSTSRSDDEEYAMAVRNFKKFFRRKGKFVRCGDPNHLIGNCPKPPRKKDQQAFVGGCWSDSENEAEDKTNDETCLMDQSSNE